jgi:general secretion pathway protein C
MVFAPAFCPTPQVPHRRGPVEHEEKQEQRVVNPSKWAATGAIIAVAALVVAFGAGQGLGVLLRLPEGTELSKAEVAEPDAAAGRRSRSRDSTRALSKNSYLDPILRRNIFDSTAVGTTASTDVDTGIDGRRTSLDVTLLATVVAEPDSYSSALISSGDKREASVRGYGIGDNLLDEATILRIEQKKVVIRRDDGTIEYIDMGGEGTKAASSSRRSSKGAEDEEGGITKTGDYSWEVDQSVIANAMGNIDSLISQVRATPHKGPDGEIDGFRLSAIRRGSLLQKLGIKNGDVIHGVNGTPLSSATGAMGAFQAMQSESSFNFDVTRRNQKNTFEYTIR